MVQLERLQYLVSTRVHVADVLVGESRWLEGSWIIQGDALLGVDMSKAEIKDRDEKARTAVDRPAPAGRAVGPASTTRRASNGTSSPGAGSRMAGLILGDRPAMEKQAMLEAQRLVERAAGTEDNKAAARQGVEGMLGGVLSRCRLAGLGPVEVTAEDPRTPQPGRSSEIVRGVLAVRSTWHGPESRRGPEQPGIYSQNSQNSAERAFLRILRIVSSGVVSPARCRLRKPGPYGAMSQPASAERAGLGVVQRPRSSCSSIVASVDQTEARDASGSGSPFKAYILFFAR